VFIGGGAWWLLPHFFVLDFSIKSAIVISIMKTTNNLKMRSVFTSGVNLGGVAHKPKKGKGAYTRKEKYAKNWD
jgi:hypothetical protein